MIKIKEATIKIERCINTRTRIYSKDIGEFEWKRHNSSYLITIQNKSEYGLINYIHNGNYHDLLNNKRIKKLRPSNIYSDSLLQCRAIIKLLLDYAKKNNI